MSVRAIGNLEQGRVGQPRGVSVRLLANALGLVGPERRRFEDAARQRLEDPGRPVPEGLGGVAAGSWPASQRLAPCQLPPEVADFTGRAEQVTRLGGLLAATGDGGAGAAVVVSAVAGQAGIGKTALAIHVAHQLRDRFPDGQLYVNLRGAQQQPLPATLVLARFLRALGMDGAAIPEDVEEREALYRARRVLVVLDNAASEAQVRPLLPGTPGCGVLVTSRAQLAGLEGARLVHLDVLEEPQALELLGRIVGAERVAAEPEGAAQIAAFCGRLPLAIRVAGARLAARPGWPLVRLVELLADARRRLDQLAAGDLEVRASLALSYQALSVEQQRALRRLGALEVGDFSAWLAGPLLGVGHDQAEELVERLAEAQLLELAAVDPTGASRYRFHDLVRLYARERSSAEDSLEERRLAVAGVTAGWLAMAEQADARLPVTAFVVSFGGGGALAVAPSAGRSAAGRPPGLVRAGTGQPAGRCRDGRRRRAGGAGLGAGRLSDQLPAAAQLPRILGYGPRACPGRLPAGRQPPRRGRHPLRPRRPPDRGGPFHHQPHPGPDHAHPRPCHLPGSQRRPRSSQGLARPFRPGAQGRTPSAPSGARVGGGPRPAGPAAGPGHRRSRREADALIALGRVYQELARYQEAAAALEEARGLVERLGARRDLAIVIFHLGVQARETGRPSEAIALLNESMAIARELDDSRGQAQLLLELGKLHSDQGGLEEAEALLAAATELWPPQVQGLGFRAMALDELGRLRSLQGRYDQAIEHLTEAARLWQQLGAAASQARTLTVLGDTLATAGHSHQARAARHQARALQQHDPGA